MLWGPRVIIGTLGREDAAAIRDLLEASGLPTGDIEQRAIRFLGSRDDHGLAAVVGLELFGKVGLLRSLAVRPDIRGTGLGGTLVGAAEELSAQHGIVELFLLTTTAEPFFGKRGYSRHDRGSAPAPIRDTPEFSDLCPSTAAFMAKHITANRPLRVLFLCTGNSARSQIAETVLNRRGQGRFEAQSAGSQPAEVVNPLALEVLSESGFQWAGHPPRGLDGLDQESWDFVITVCDRARESCPIFPGQPVLAHWGMEDPAAIAGPPDARLRAFRDALTLLSRRIDLFLNLPVEKLERLALQHQVQAIADEDSPATV